MANEISLAISFGCFKPAIMSSPIGRNIPSLLRTMTGNFYSQGSILVGLSAIPIPLGQVTTPHWMWLNNLDATNYILLQNGFASPPVGQWFAGDASWFPFYSAGVPYVVANTAPCEMEYLILSL